jgi:two-component system, response regulator RegA
MNATRGGTSSQAHSKVSAPGAEVAAKMLLLVEDDNALRLLLRGFLETQGYTVLEADCRTRALDTLNQHKHLPVVILDLGLPPSPHTTVEGLSFIRTVRTELHPAKIIVLTGQDQESAALDAIREGAFDFLAKPATSTDIAQAVRRAFLFCRKETEMAADGFTHLHLKARISDGLKAVREEAEEKLVRKVLKDTGFNVYQSAARLGLKRESIYYFLKKFGIERHDD